MMLLSPAHRPRGGAGPEGVGPGARNHHLHWAASVLPALRSGAFLAKALAGLGHQGVPTARFCRVASRPNGVPQVRFTRAASSCSSRLSACACRAWWPCGVFVAALSGGRRRDGARWIAPWPSPSGGVAGVGSLTHMAASGWPMKAWPACFGLVLVLTAPGGRHREALALRRAEGSGSLQGSRSNCRTQFCKVVWIQRSGWQRGQGALRTRAAGHCHPCPARKKRSGAVERQGTHAGVVGDELLVEERGFQAPHGQAAWLACR